MKGLRFDIEFGDDSVGSGFLIGPTGKLLAVDGDASIRQSIRMILSTRPGERVMRPDFGCGIHHLVFAASDASTSGLAVHFVTQALSRWEPRIELLDVRAETTEGGGLELYVDYRIRATGGRELLVHGFDLEGELT